MRLELRCWSRALTDSRRWSRTTLPFLSTRKPLRAMRRPVMARTGSRSSGRCQSRGICRCRLAAIRLRLFALAVVLVALGRRFGEHQRPDLGAVVGKLFALEQRDARAAPTKTAKKAFDSFGSYPPARFHCGRHPKRGATCSCWYPQLHVLLAVKAVTQRHTFSSRLPPRKNAPTPYCQNCQKGFWQFWQLPSRPLFTARSPSG